jgi:hypothetical protein
MVTSMQREDIQRLLESPPGTDVEIVMPPISGKPVGIKLNEPTSSLGSQVRFVAEMVKAGAFKSNNFQKMGMLEVKGRTRISLPLSLVLQEIGSKENTNNLPLAKSFSSTSMPAKRYYLNGGWKEIAETFGTDGLKAAFDSKSFNQIVEMASSNPAEPRLMIVPGATPMHVSTPGASMVIVGNGAGSEAARLIVDAVKEYSMARASKSPGVMIANGVSPDLVVNSEVQKHGVGLMAGIKAAAELNATSPRYQAMVSKNYPEFRKQLVGQIADLENQLQDTVINNPAAFNEYAGKLGRRELEREFELDQSPSMSG